MRILFLTPQLPYPPRQGTALRNWGLISGLAGRHEIWLLSFDEAGAARGQTDGFVAPLRDACARIAAFPIPPRTTGLRLRTLLSSRLPDMAWRLWSPDFAAQFNDWVGHNPFDIVQIEGIELARYALESPISESQSPFPSSSTTTTANTCSSAGRTKPTAAPGAVARCGLLVGPVAPAARFRTAHRPRRARDAVRLRPGRRRDPADRAAGPASRDRQRHRRAASHTADNTDRPTTDDGRREGRSRWSSPARWTSAGTSTRCCGSAARSCPWSAGRPGGAIAHRRPAAQPAAGRPARRSGHHDHRGG